MLSLKKKLEQAFTTTNHTPKYTFEVNTTVYIQTEKEDQDPYAFIVAYKLPDKPIQTLTSPINLAQNLDYGAFANLELIDSEYNDDDMHVPSKSDSGKAYVPNILRF